jgi:hypothetical protein
MAFNATFQVSRTEELTIYLGYEVLWLLFHRI